MDFHALQNKLFELDPTDPKEDLAKLRAQAHGNSVSVVPVTAVFVSESVDGPQGSLKMDKEYSVTDFAALAGVVTESKQKPADKVRGSETMPAAKPGRTEHPFKDRLVGEQDEDRITSLERRIEALESMLSERELTKPESKEKERIVKGMKKNKGDFKDRYGDDAESVMYATATKNAKKAESVDSIKDALYAALNKRMGN